MKSPFFIMGLPRSRTAWLSVMMSSGPDTFCWHEGLIGCESFEQYAARLRSRPETNRGDSNSMLPYHVEAILKEFPESDWAIVHRDAESSRKALIASEPGQEKAINQWWPSYLQRFHAACAMVERSTRAPVWHVNVAELYEFQACRLLFHYLTGGQLDEARWQQLDGLKITVHEKRVDGPVPVTKRLTTSLPTARSTEGLSARAYEAADFPTVNAWCIEHKGHDMDERRMPPLGVMVEDQRGARCALFSHMAVSRGVAFLEDPVSRPGLSLIEARAGFSYALGAIKEALAALNYTHIVCHTIPAIGRELERNHGFARQGERIRMEGQI